MVQFAKLIGLNRNLSTFRKYPLQQGGHSSQRQLRLGLGFQKLVRLGWSPLFLENRPNDFLAFWHEVRSL